MPQLTHEPEIRGVTIVFLGAFNPRIFHPSWFGANGLLAPEEAVEASVDVITNEISAFHTNWFNLQVTADRFSVATRDFGKAWLLRDLAVGSFNILEHTPLTALGLNSDLHFLMPTEEEWHAVGHALAPKTAWLEILENPGLTSVSMVGTRQGCSANTVSLKLQPSTKVKPGIYIGLNQHYALEQSKEGGDIRSVAQRNELAMDVLSNEWDNFCSYSMSSALHLLSSHKTSQ